MKQFEVEIMGQPYVLGCPEGGEHRLHAAVAQVDGTMNRIREAGKVRARDRIAVLAALNLALELVDQAHRPAEPSMPAEPVPPEPDASALQDAARLQALLQRLDDALAQDAPAVIEQPVDASSPDDASSAPAPQHQDDAEQATDGVAGAAAGDGEDARTDDGRSVIAPGSASSDTEVHPPSKHAPGSGETREPTDRAGQVAAEDSIQNSGDAARALHG